MKKFASLFILLAGILWGSMGLFVRRLNDAGLETMEIVALRAVVTCVILFLFLLLFHRRLLKIHWKDIWCFLGTGICSIVFFNFCYFKAITMTSLSIAAVLLYTAPAIVMVLSYFFFRERFTKRKVLSLFMTFAGCVLVTGVCASENTVTAGGVLAGLGAGFGYALYSIFSRFALERGYHSLTITFYTFLLAAVGTFFLADMGQVRRVASEDGGMILFCIAFGVLCTVVPYLSYTLGLQYVDNSKAAVIASVEPVAAAVLGVVLFREKLTITAAAGIGLVLTALAICRDEGKRE